MSEGTELGLSGQMGTEEFGTDYADLWNHDSLPPHMRDPAGSMYNYLKQSKKKQKKMNKPKKKKKTRKIKKNKKTKKIKKIKPPPTGRFQCSSGS